MSGLIIVQGVAEDALACEHDLSLCAHGCRVCSRQVCVRPAVHVRSMSHRAAVSQALSKLHDAAGNFYVCMCCGDYWGIEPLQINCKSTGAIVGQQPFGGSRASGSLMLEDVLRVSLTVKHTRHKRQGWRCVVPGLRSLHAPIPPTCRRCASCPCRRSRKPLRLSPTGATPTCSDVSLHSLFTSNAERRPFIMR